MQAIKAPIKPGETGPQVVNLQDALHLLITRGVVRARPRARCAAWWAVLRLLITRGAVRVVEPPGSPTATELTRLANDLTEERTQALYGMTTRRLVRIVQLQQGLGEGLDGAVESRTAARLNELLKEHGALDAIPMWVVRGTVRDANGQAVAGITVNAVDRDVRRRDPLGNPTHTDDQGRYAISYAPTLSSGAELRGPDLQVRASGPGGSGESAVVFNAASDATIDLTLSALEIALPSEFESYIAEVTPLLVGQADDGGGDLGIEHLEEADIEFLAAETGIDKQHLGWLHAAFQVGDKLASTEHARAACYGWFRMAVAPRLDAIRARSPGELRQLLLGAIDERIVPASLKPAVESLLAGIGHPEWTAVRNLLGRIGLAEAQAVEIAQRLDSIEAIDEVTLRGFVQAGTLKQSHADRLGLAASLHRLTSASAPTVELALGRTFDSLGERRLDSSEDLARLQHSDWVALLQDSAATIPDGSSLETFATDLEEICAGAYPTVAMIQRAVRAPSAHAAPLATIVASNPGADLLSLDLTTDSDDLAKLDLGTLTPEQGKGAIGRLKTMQRVLSVAIHPTHAQKLIDAGYLHSTRIALATQTELMERAALSENDAMRVLDRAHTASLAAVHAWMAVRDAQADRQLINGVGMAITSASGAGTQIARWAELFGSADYCACDHCQSVLGPGAYFVDLMHYVESFILLPSTAVPSEMQLATRRGDLWTEKLISCKSTDEVVPTLDIVCELLEAWIRRQSPTWVSYPVIYRGIADPASANPSFGLPINFALDRLEILLAHFGLSRDRIVQVLGGTGRARLQSRLKTWPSELALIQESRADKANAGSYFSLLYQVGGAGIPNDPGFLDQPITAFSLGDLQIATGLDRDVLRLLVRSRFASRDGSTVDAVSVTLTAPAGAVQNTIEAVSNLSRRRLDRLHRLVRLWRKLPWTVEELDYALVRITPGNEPPDKQPATLDDPDDATLHRVVELLDLADSTGLAFDEVMALWDEAPGESFSGRASLFDRRFNAEPFARSARWPDALPLNLQLPVTANSTAGADSTAARLLAALRMNESDFVDLIETLKSVAVPGGFVTLIGAVPTSLLLSKTTLPVLYRHALLCRVLKVKPDELMRLVRLTPEIAARATPAQPLDAQSVTSLADVAALQRFVTWQRHSGYSAKDIVWLVDPAQRPDDVSDSAEAAARVVKRVAADRLVVFPATVFTAAGFSEAQSREIMASLEGTAVERTVVQGSGAAAASASAAPQEAEYRLKSALADTALEGFVTNAISPWAFDVAHAVVLGLARRLTEFDDTDFTAIFLTPDQSRDLVVQNIDDGMPTSPRRPFLSFEVKTTPPSIPPLIRFRLNPAYPGAQQPAPIAAPRDAAGAAINLAGTIVLGFLKSKAAEIALGQTSAARTAADTLFTEIFLSEQQSRWLVALNPIVVPNAGDPTKSARAFVSDPVGKDTVLNISDIGNATVPPVLDDVLSAVRGELVARLRAFDPLVVADRVVAAEVELSADVVAALREASTTVQASLGGVQAVNPAEIYGDLSPPTTLPTLIGQLQRLGRLFVGTRFDAAAVRLALIAWDAAFEGLTSHAVLDIGRLEAIAAYAVWLRLPAQPPSSPDPEQAARRNALDKLLHGAGPASLGDPQWNPAVAKVLDATEAEVRSLGECPQLWNGKWHQQLDRAAKALEITRRLGVGGRTLARIGGFDPVTDPVDDLFKAADDIYGTFRAKYPDEASYREKSEAFEDLIRGRRRDALVAHIAAMPADIRWPDLRTASEMYAHFLMDVQVGGCARTSRLVAAISSVQLFVHRVLMGLEPARFGEKSDAQEARGQWFWRKNYRVWEANRKVFLFPENFIEPDLRDDKTPLFRALEDELLQRRITTAEAEESYRNYLTGYSEVAGLKIVGAFHDVQTGRDLGIAEQGADDIFIDVLHLVGVTADDPPIHYMRRVGNLTRSRGVDGAKHPVQFSPWEKLSTQIPVRWVSPVVYYRKLRLFWNEITTVPTTRRFKKSTDFEGGTYFDGYEHRFKVKWIEQKPSGGWTAPQELKFVDGNDIAKRAYVDDLVSFIRPGALAEVPTNEVNGTKMIESFTLRPGEALAALEQDQPFAEAKVYCEYEMPIVKGSTQTKAVQSISKNELAFKAVPRTQSQLRRQRAVAGAGGLFSARWNWDSMMHHGAAMDEFTVSGWKWDLAFPAVRYVGEERKEELQIAAMNPRSPGYVHGFLREPDRRVSFVAFDAIERGEDNSISAHLTNGFVVAVAGVSQLPRFNIPVGNHFWQATSNLLGGSATANLLAFGAPVSDALVVNARAEASEAAETLGASPFRASCIVESGNLQALLVNDASRHRFVNLSTSTAHPLLRRLATGSLPGLLDKDFQKNLKEDLPLVTVVGGVDIVKGTDLNFEGAYGTYLREIFFHMPFLVANHLNSQQRFEESQRWYHYIFNPMAPFDPKRPGSSSPWRYREFVNPPVESVREVLTNAAALAAYRNDPFNPHAIARLRLSAYQKAIVMKYIDNLLDWGDQLFAQFTMESVNEATMLYVLAADILGERPNRLPKCMEDQERSYDEIKPNLSEVSDLLIEEMEHQTIVIPPGSGATVIHWPEQQDTPIVARMAVTAGGGIGAGAPDFQGDAVGAQLPGTGGAGVDPRTGPKYWASPAGRPLADLYQDDSTRSAGGLAQRGTESTRFTTPPIDFEGGRPGGGGIFGGGDLGEIKLDPTGLIPGRGLDLDIKYTLHDAPPLHRDLFERVPTKPNVSALVPAHNIFCFPVNKDLLDYHDRVQDRLTKIRSCMDIAGVRRRLALFAPEIDPRLLVRMKAAGLSLEDVLDSTSGHAPPYRFNVLLERARQYASTVQGLGAQLLSAIEKRDGEELAVLRTVHERDLLGLRTQSVRMEIDAANDAFAGLQRQKEAADLRQQHFQSLLSGGLIPSEQAQQAFSMLASGLGMTSATLELVAAIAGALPDAHVGIAAAVVTGGRSAATVLNHIAVAARAGATVADWGSKAAGTQASFDRRAQDWKFQADIARKDVAQLAKQVDVAEIRVAMAEKALEVHQKSIEQAQEIYTFYRSKFSSFGLYTWLSTQLHRYHRTAFDAAWNMARAAEKALHFERPELRETVLLGPPAWSPDRAGLLAGESLLLQLQRLEAGYLLTNARQIEVEQTFSLAQYFPDKLITLRQTGECDFDVPEFVFDLSGPGQYFRRIKAVRLSLPCVVGPDTSVGATLRMTRSYLRETPDAAASLVEVPLRHSTTIMASSAQSDAGVFEFNFRDERLLPFEGMGAVSSWNLRLPKNLRPFAYESIADVKLRISYTARDDDALREAVDAVNGAIFRLLQEAAPRVVLSLRRDFPAEWARFKDSTANNDGRYAASIGLSELNYPWWLRNFLAAEEDVVLHVLIEEGVDDPVNAQWGTGKVELLDETPPPEPATALDSRGLHWSKTIPGGKPRLATATTQTLSVSFNRKDMRDVFIVLVPVGQL